MDPEPDVAVHRVNSTCVLVTVWVVVGLAVTVLALTILVVAIPVVDAWHVLKSMNPKYFVL